jgi:glucose dehydrogenase
MVYVSSLIIIGNSATGALIMLKNRFRLRWALYCLGFSLVAYGVNAQTGKQGRDWPVYGGDPGGNKYSSLNQINKTNVADLEIAWKWSTGEKTDPARGVHLGPFEAVPLMIDDVLYLSTSYTRVVALDAKSGKQIWSYDPRSYEVGTHAEQLGILRGTHHRGVAAWTDGKQRRILLNTRWRLIALDTQKGQPIATFGREGEVDLTEAMGRTENKYEYDQTSPPVVYKNLVILGSRVPDPHPYDNKRPGPPPGDIMAFDVKSGKLVWRFRTIPIKGEPGNETWEDDAWKTVGHANAWPPIALDEKRGLVYLPVTTAGDDYYGANRKGNNLFADSLVCLNASTGKLVWYFQTVHHGLWDYDGVMMPNLVTIRKDGRSMDLVAAVSKTGFTYVFDRVTGKPVWPIEERPVPQSDVPGEKTSPTQPFPTKPLPFAKQGFTLDDVVDFTPELKEMALAKLKDYRIGPMFTPPSFQGTVMLPSNSGGANWGGSSFDPESENLYVRGANIATVLRLEPKPPGSPMGTLDVTTLPTIEGIPVNKPPYSTLTAINMNTGDHVWQRPIGDTPAVRNHALLKGVNLPAELGVRGESGSLVTRGGFLAIAPGDSFLYFIDKDNGKTLGKFDLGVRGVGGNPMTYETREGRQYIVIAAGGGDNATLVAFALRR